MNATLRANHYGEGQVLYLQLVCPTMPADRVQLHMLYLEVPVHNLQGATKLSDSRIFGEVMALDCMGQWHCA